MLVKRDLFYSTITNGTGTRVPKGTCCRENGTMPIMTRARNPLILQRLVLLVLKYGYGPNAHLLYFMMSDFFKHYFFMESS